MGLLGMVFGHVCEMCSVRGQGVAWWETHRKYLHAKCKRQIAAADRSKPHGSSAARYRAGSGQPVKLAGPMGSAYRGPAPRNQRRT